MDRDGDRTAAIAADHSDAARLELAVVEVHPAGAQPLFGARAWSLSFNLTTGKVEPLATPVDRSLPDTGSNRSAFQRFLQALHDTNGLSICTKPGAVAHIVWKGLKLDFPSIGAQAACVILGAPPPKNPMPACGIIRIENIAHDLIDSAIGQVKLDIRDECLRKLSDSPLNGIGGGADGFLEEVSGIKGFRTQPTVPAISRLVFFDLPHDGLPGDTQNPTTKHFIEDLLEPAQTMVCPPAPFTDTDGHVMNLRKCASFNDTVRGRDAGALFSTRSGSSSPGCANSGASTTRSTSRPKASRSRAWRACRSECRSRRSSSRATSRTRIRFASEAN